MNMPLNCSTATQKLEALELLRTELGNTLVLLKDAHNQTIAGGITKEEKEKREEVIQTLKTKARAIKQELETGIKEMNREMLMFVVSDAVNPYREGLIEAGLPIDHPECAEKKEIAIDMEEVIEEYIQHYRDQKMPTWAEDIEANEELLSDILLDPEEKERIEKRIEAGMIPIVMPSRETQQRSWEQSLENLKPVWIQEGKEIELKPVYIYKEGYEEKMEPPIAKISDGKSFFDSLPDRPYIVWVKPTKTVDSRTRELISQDQIILLNKLHNDNPDLVDTKDITPTEYAVLQSRYTREIQRLNIEHNPNNPAQNIRPLDYYKTVNSDASFTRFLSAGLFSGGFAPYVCFDSTTAKLYFEANLIDESSLDGFRPAART